MLSRPGVDPDAIAKERAARGPRCDELKAQADARMMAYQESAQLTALEDAIALYDQALQLRPQETEDRAVSLSDLGNALWEFCQLHEQDKVRLDRAVLLLREALHLRPLGHEARDSALNSLARALWVSFEQFGDAEKVKEATSLHREALQLRPRGHPARIQTLGNLANILMEANEARGRAESLGEALGLLREALNILPLGHPLRDRVINNLGCCLRYSFEHHGRPDLLADAIVMDREALQLRPVGHPLRDTSLDSLAESLFISFKRYGDLNVLSEAIALKREALSLRGSSHPLRAHVLSTLAEALRLECHFRPQPNALDEPISLLREAVSVSANGHIVYDQFLIYLADALQADHNQNGRDESLLEAVGLYRKALQFQPPGNYMRPDTLCGLGLLMCQPSLRAWSEALAMFHEALESCPKGHPSRVRLLCGASACYLVPDSPYFDVSKGIAHLSQALDEDCSPARERLSLAIPKLELLGTALSATTMDPEASVQLTVNILRTYRQAIGLLPRAANLGLYYHARLQAVAGSDGISRDGAAWALRLKRVSEAVEMLEEGRGVFWGQALRLRAPGLDKVPAEDRAELQRLFSLLEQSEGTLKEPQLSVMQREAKAENRRRWNEEAEAVISRIRTYPGLSRFLLPGPGTFDNLMQSLPHGFVVVLNASKLGCHALLLDGTTGLATSMEIKPFRGGFDVGSITALLPRDIMFETSAAQSFQDDDTRAMRRVSAAGDLDRFERTLADLWTQIAQPIISKLRLMKATGRARPRLWWCATGDLGFLPIHAAGKYRGAGQEGVADYVVSSYTPTLSTLIRVRRGWQPVPRSHISGVLISEASAAGVAYLPNVGEEARVVCGCFEEVHAQLVNTHSTHTTVDQARTLLEGTPAHVLHMACHGVQQTNPLDSAFVLGDGRLSIEDIMQLDLPHAVLAFLSACQTAKGDRSAPDEAVHLAASMLFCGFRSVISTMWLMHDTDGPKIARRVYEGLFARDQLDLDDIPYALDEAVRELRCSGVISARWALFVHLGG